MSDEKKVPGLVQRLRDASAEILKIKAAETLAKQAETLAKQAELAAEEAARREEEDAQLKQMKSGLAFCQANTEDIRALPKSWQYLPPTQFQDEALRRFGISSWRDGAFGPKTKATAQNVINGLIDEAQRKLIPRTWDDEASTTLRTASTWMDGALQRDELRKKVLALLGDVCAVCGADDPNGLEIDHRHNGGAQHRRECTPVEIYQHVLRFGRAEFELLCGYHHNIKTAEARERAQRERNKP